MRCWLARLPACPIASLPSYRINLSPGRAFRHTGPTKELVLCGRTRGTAPLRLGSRHAPIDQTGAVSPSPAGASHDRLPALPFRTCPFRPHITLLALSGSANLSGIFALHHVDQDRLPNPLHTATAEGGKGFAEKAALAQALSGPSLGRPRLCPGTKGSLSRGFPCTNHHGLPPRASPSVAWVTCLPKESAGFYRHSH